MSLLDGRQDAPYVIVLILSYNGRNLLKTCLPSVLGMDYPNCDVVVIDNGSTDGTREFLREEHPEVQVIEIYPNVGYARGFNAGLEFAAKQGAEYFLIMNNDTVIDRGALSSLVETAIREEDAGFVTGKVYFLDQPKVLQTVGKVEDPVNWSGKDIGWQELDEGQYEDVTERVFADDVYTLVNRGVYEDVGGYDPTFFLQCEEWDWQIRAKKAGWRILYTPHARLWHQVSATTGGLGSPTTGYFLYRNRMIVIAKHGGLGRLLRFLIGGGFELLDRFLRGILQLDWDKAKPRLARLLGFTVGLWWLIRRQSSDGVPWLIQRLEGIKVEEAAT